MILIFHKVNTMTISTPVYTESQLKLKVFIDAENADFIKRCQEKGHTVITTMTADIDYWAESGVYTIEEYLHSCAASNHSDFFKELNNSRPRWAYNTMTTEEILLAIDDLAKQSDSEQAYDAKIKAEKEAEHKQRIKDNSYKPNLAFSSLKDVLKSA